MTSRKRTGLGAQWIIVMVMKRDHLIVGIEFFSVRFNIFKCYENQSENNRMLQRNLWCSGLTEDQGLFPCLRRTNTFLTKNSTI